MPRFFVWCQVQKIQDLVLIQVSILLNISIVAFSLALYSSILFMIGANFCSRLSACLASLLSLLRLSAANLMRSISTYLFFFCSNYLLAQARVDAPALANSIAHLNASTTFSPLQPLHDTDVNGYLRHAHEQTLISILPKERLVVVVL